MGECFLAAILWVPRLQQPDRLLYDARASGVEMIEAKNSSATNPDVETDHRPPPLYSLHLMQSPQHEH